MVGKLGYTAVSREVAARTGYLLAERLGCWVGGESLHGSFVEKFLTKNQPFNKSIMY